MMPLRTHPATTFGTTVTAAGPVRHQCPVVDEVDQGTASITWTTTEVTIELHSLAAYLATWDGIHISHEDLAFELAEHIAGMGVRDVRVVLNFTTAGFDVEVSRGGAAV